MTSFSIPAETRLGPVYLITADLARSVDFYQRVIGLRLLDLHDGRAQLGGDETLLVLNERPNAVPKALHSTGLYHFALLMPARRDLSRSLRHLMRMGQPLQGASDHLVSEALYLADPDGNGIEIYADRPRENWRMHNGQIEMATVPLNMASLLAESDEKVGVWDGLPGNTRIGHIHLHVANLAQSETFYCNGLGLDLMARYGPSAAFISAGGYHHHIGINTWLGAGAPPPPKGAIGLERFTVLLPTAEALDALRDHLHTAAIPLAAHDVGIDLRDPAGNAILLAAEEAMQLTNPSTVLADHL